MYEELIDRLREEPLDSRQATLKIFDLCAEASDAVETLQAEIDRLRKYLSGRARFFECERLQEELEQVKRERDAAIEDLGSSSNNCFYCKYRSKTDKECTAVPSITGRCFEWRGVRED